MRLGKKKEKDKELEIRSVDGITRLICLSKGQAPLKGALYNKVSIPLHYQHRRVYLRCIWRCKTQIRFSAVALQNSIMFLFFPLQILQILKSSSMMSLKMLLSSKISMQFQVVSQKILTKLFPSLLWYTFKNSFLYSRTNYRNSGHEN